MSPGLVLLTALLTALVSVTGSYFVFRGKKVDAASKAAVAQVTTQGSVEAVTASGKFAVDVAKANQEPSMLDRAFGRMEVLEQRLTDHERERRDDAERHHRERLDDAQRHAQERREDADKCQKDLEALRGEVSAMSEALAQALIDRNDATARHDASQVERGQLKARCEELSEQCQELTRRIATIENTTSNPKMQARPRESKS